MCGLIGYVGDRPAQPVLLAGLEQLEYRGYDSAGLCIADDSGFRYARAVGDLESSAGRQSPGPPRPRGASATRAGRLTAGSPSRTPIP